MYVMCEGISSDVVCCTCWSNYTLMPFVEPVELSSLCAELLHVDEAPCAVCVGFHNEPDVKRKDDHGTQENTNTTMSHG